MKKYILSFAAAVVIFTSAVFASDSQRPKNIIFLIGDGMGINFVASSVYILDNDQFKKFPTVALVVTCPADKLITDSAAGATAYSTGYRTKNGYVGIAQTKNRSEIFLN